MCLITIIYMYLVLYQQTVGWSAVFFAAKEGYLSIIKTLIRAGANVTQKDKVCFLTVVHSEF